jgi:spermidine synthase
MKFLLITLLSFFVLLLSIDSLNAKQVDKARSIYRNVVMVEKDDRLCMRFETRRKRKSNQACIDINDPQRLVFEYAQGVMASYLVNPKPQRVLIIGLGGGVLSNAIHQLSPQAEIINVDIDPVVVKFARKYFSYQENEQVKTVIKDGRVYVKRALLDKEKFDWIILDAFNGDYIPEHLMTQEFLTEVKGLLSPKGLLVANTFSSSKLFDYESVTYQKVFEKLYTFKTPTKGNRLIFASNQNSEAFNFSKPSSSFINSLKPYKVNIKSIVERITDKVNWNPDSKVLTDQYSPANLLK